MRRRRSRVASPATCHWHPDRETGLRCGNCGKPVCFECVRQHPVGIRCKECARSARLPTYRFSQSDAARGIAAAVGLGLAGAVVLFVLVRLVFRRFLLLHHPDRGGLCDRRGRQQGREPSARAGVPVHGAGRSAARHERVLGARSALVQLRLGVRAGGRGRRGARGVEPPGAVMGRALEWRGGRA